ncbi:Pre-mRNA-splicing factor cwc26 [Collariella sp. IMI 366227]|nr:Pre-mRNA-splicing factor cwc26 [Collariella sp. IMI 366227]
MPPDKAAYLTARYLSSDSKPSSSSTKKRKRKQPITASGLLITDDDETGWGGSTTTPLGEADDDAPLTIAGTTSEFRRTKKSAWKPLGGGSSKTDSADADAIIASAAAESAALAAAEAAEDLLPPTPLMSNGAQAGLQSASALTAQLRIRQQQEAAELAALKATASNTPQTEHQDSVILRDATGRRIDASLHRAELRRQAAEAERAARAKLELLKGEVQVAAARERRERLADAALMPVARGKDDVEMNEGLRAEGRWNDPMAQFLEEGGDGEGSLYTMDIMV